MSPANRERHECASPAVRGILTTPLAFFLVISSALSDTAEVYQFNALTPGVSIVGQDGWQSLYGGTGDMVQTAVVVPGLGSVQTIQSPGGQFVKENFSTNSFAGAHNLEIDALIQYYDGSPFSLGLVATGAVEAAGNATQFIAPQCTIGWLSPSNTHVARLRGGANNADDEALVALPVSIADGDWVRFKLLLGLTGLGSVGEVNATLFYWNLTEGETNFTVVPGLHNVALSVSNMAVQVRSPAAWRGVWMQHDNLFGTPGRVAELGLSEWRYGAVIDESIVDVEVHVDQTHPSASDSNPGTNAAMPLLTVQKAIDVSVTKLNAGQRTRVWIHPGRYRFGSSKTLDTSGDPTARDTLLILQGTDRGKVILSGAESWTNWASIGGGLYVKDWPYNWKPNPEPWAGSAFYLGLLPSRRELVLFNGRPLRQVNVENWSYNASSNDWTYAGYLGVSSLIPGTYGVSEVQDKKIYLYPPAGADPNVASVEVGITTRVLLLSRKNNLVLRNLTVEGCSSYIPDPAVMITQCTNVLIEACDFRFNNASGLGHAKPRFVTFRSCSGNDNGWKGFTGTGVQFLFEDGEAARNNWRGAWGGVYSWDAAGHKFGAMQSALVRRACFFDNQASGLWFDVYCQSPVEVEEGYAFNNYNRGFFWELSVGPALWRDSVSAWNSSGMRVVNAQNAAFRRCQSANNHSSQFYAAANSRIPTTRHVTVESCFFWGRDTNRIYDATSDVNFDYPVYLGTFRGSRNVYHQPDNAKVFFVPINATAGMATNFAGWKSALIAQGSPAPDADAQWLDPGSAGAGRIRRSVWRDAPGTNLNAIPLGLPPDETSDVVLFEHNHLLGDNVGVQLRGLLVPPATAMWRFWISGGDAAELWLSTDANRSNAQRVAWTTVPTAFRGFDENPAQTTSRGLVKGEKYYVEARQKGGTKGANHVSVAWRNESGNGAGGLLNERHVINALHVQPYAPATAWPPALTATLSAGDLLLTWSADADGYWLQTATNLASPVFWQPVAAPPAITNGLNAVLLPATNHLQCFRLSSR